MAKSLRNIIVPRAGRNVPKGEEDFLAKHSVDEKPYPNGDNEKAFTAKVVKPEAKIQKNDPGMRHGYRSQAAAEKAYEETMPKVKKKKDLSKEDDRNVNAPSYSTEYSSSGSSVKSEAKDPREYGYEGDMAITQLKTICRHAEHLMKMMKPDTDLPEWVQSKITKAEDYITTAHDYLMSEMNEEVEDIDESDFEKNLTKIQRARLKAALIKSDPKNPVNVEKKKREAAKEKSDWYNSFKKPTSEEVEEVDEVLKKSDPTGKWISDFVHSDNPKFADKSKEKRIDMALGAKYAKMREETEEVEEGAVTKFVKDVAKNTVKSTVRDTLNKSFGQVGPAIAKSLGNKLK